MNTPSETASRKVAAELRAAIDRGDLHPGAKLPSERELSATYDVARNTAREAVRQLADSGLVTAEHGRGVFVRERAKPKRHGVDRYSRSRWKDGGAAIHDAEAGGQGLSVKQVYREIGEVPAPQAVAEAFNVEVGAPVLVRRRTTVVDDRPHQLADSYYPLDVARGTLLEQENSGPGGGFARIDEAGKPLAEISEEWESRMPTAFEATELDLPTGTPVFDGVRTTYDSDGRAVEVMTAVIAADTVRLSYRFPIPD